MLYLGRIGRPNIQVTVNYLARHVTKWNRACDKRLARLMSYIHHTGNYRQDCQVGNKTSECKLGRDKMPTLLETWQSQNQRLAVYSAYSEVKHLCQFRGDAKKQTAVSRSSTEAGITSLDAGLRMKGIPALGLWNTVIDVLEPIAQGDQMRNQEQKQNDKRGKVNWCAARLFMHPPDTDAPFEEHVITVRNRICILSLPT